MHDTYSTHTYITQEYVKTCDEEVQELAREIGKAREKLDLLEVWPGPPWTFSAHAYPYFDTPYLNTRTNAQDFYAYIYIQTHSDTQIQVKSD
jgi:hypothetical protein